ncbi:hypothetical protein BN1723_019830, partial [Verticillium longisporum]
CVDHSRRSRRLSRHVWH